MLRAILAFCIATTIAAAQKTEIGGTIGTGATFTAQGNFWEAGLEGCLYCGGRFGLFVEYSHWWLTPPGGQTSRLDLGGGGLRIQGKNQHVRPFFDAGISLGRYDGKPHDFVHRSELFVMGGVTLGGGVAISIAKGFYVRPQLRVAGGIGAVVGYASMGAGYRF